MNKQQVISLVLVLVAVVAVVGLKTQRPSSTPSTAPSSQARALPSLFELGSTSCDTCKRMAPIIAGLSEELAGKVTVKALDVFSDTTLADTYQIKAIPTQVFRDANGREVFRHIGFFSREEILAKMQELGWR